MNPKGFNIVTFIKWLNLKWYNLNRYIWLQSFDKLMNFLIRKEIIRYNKKKKKWVSKTKNFNNLTDDDIKNLNILLDEIQRELESFYESIKN